MPYVPKERRREIMLGRRPENVGELTYLLSRAVDDYVAREGRLSYALLAEGTAALENAKLEYYRRVVRPYEDLKCLENGEVFRSAHLPHRTVRSST